MNVRGALAALAALATVVASVACGDEPRPPVVTERFPGPTIGGSQSEPAPAPTSTSSPSDGGRTPASSEAGVGGDAGGTVLACACTLQLSNGSIVGLPCNAELCDPPIFIVYACDSIARLSSRTVTGC